MLSSASEVCRKQSSPSYGEQSVGAKEEAGYNREGHVETRTLKGIGMPVCNLVLSAANFTAAADWFALRILSNAGQHALEM